MYNVTIFTDGSCIGNPGPGGWAALLICGNKRKLISGGNNSTTNNRMELTAAIKALQHLNGKCRVKIYTDSKYIIGVGEQHFKKFKKNFDLCTQLMNETYKHIVKFIWIRGHSKIEGNEIVDKSAYSQALKFKSIVDSIKYDIDKAIERYL